MATERQKLFVQKILENTRNPKPGFTLGKTMLEVGYKPTVSIQPSLITKTKGFRELMEEHGMDDASLTRTHQELLKSTRLDHMVFPIGPLKHEDESDKDQLADTDIRHLLADVNCTVRRIVHGETARHVYFWSIDNKARKEALDMAYKLKGSYAPEKKVTLHGHVDASNPKTKAIVDKFNDELKKQLEQ
jgi:DNA-binding HxlR family transcriptional regulator